MPSQYSLPHAGAPRPALPTQERNPHINDLKVNLPAVKFQEIVRDGQSTVVARMKVPTPNGHAFILRRLDTGAISLTTMFRAAFPTASDASEKDESAWVRANFDLAGTNKSGKARFAGTWVSEATALQLAPSYSLQEILAPLLDAAPDPNVEYRKSTRAQDTPTSTRQLPTPSPSLNTVPSPAPTPSAAKRRREAPPVPEPSPAPTPAAIKTPGKGTPARLGTRRSTRMTSPAPAPVPQLVSPKTPRSPRKQAQAQVVTPAGSDETAVEEDEEEPSLGGPDMSRDIEEQKAMIESFKAQRAAQQAMEVEDEEDDSEGRKREREEDAPPSFSFKEPAQIVAEQAESSSRAIATNARVRGFQMTPQRRSLAWGVGVGAIAAAAIAYMPAAALAWF